MEMFAGALVGALVFAGGFWLGFTVRDRVRGAGEPALPLVDGPLQSPREIAIAGRHVPPRR